MSLRKLGERESKMLLEFVGTKVSKEVSITSKVLATKEDIANLKTDDIANLKTDISNVKAELKEDIFNVKAELKEDIANLKSELIKWMFIFWAGTVVLSGILKAVGVL